MTDDYYSRMTPSFFEGVLLAVNALKDVYLLAEGPGCVRDKVQRICRMHDYRSTLLDASGNHRVDTTDHGPHKVLGEVETLQRLARTMLAEGEKGALFVIPFAVPQAMGVELELVLRPLADEFDTPILNLRSEALDGDWLDGWSTVMCALADRLDLADREPIRGSAGVVGNMFTRNEGDDLGNVAELRRLVSGAGLEVLSVWAEPGPVRGLESIASCEYLLALPHGRETARRIAARTGAAVVDVPLPVGLAATGEFLRAVGEGTGRGEAAQDLAERETKAAAGKLRHFVSMHADEIGVGVLADPFLAEAMARAFQELGIEVPLVGKLTAHGSYSQERPLAAAPLADAHGSYPGERPAAVLVDPSFKVWEDEVVRLAGEGRLDLVVGSGDSEVAAHKAGIGLVEIGYPSPMEHFLAPCPYFGFRGFVRLVERINNARNATVARRRMDRLAAEPSVGERS